MAISDEFIRIGDFLFECKNCGEEVESGVMAIMGHRECCKGKPSAVVDLDHHKKIESFHIIAISEIPVDERSPVYHIFCQRKVVAKRYCEGGCNLDVYIQMIEICNEKIKECLGIW